MKKLLFVCLSIIVGFITFYFTFCAAFIDKQDGGSIVASYLLSYLGVIVPNIALEIAKFFIFKNKYKKIYSFDIISVLVCLCALIIMNILHLGLMRSDIIAFWNVWKRELFQFQFPWIIMFLAYSILLIFKAIKGKEKVIVQNH